MKAPFAYYGGKSGLADRIVALMPDHREYLEPYFGSGAVLFAKPKARIEVVNDLNGALVAFFRCLRDRLPELERVLRLTPYSREEFLAADLGAPDLDELELARRFWVRVNQSFARTANRRRGWSITTGANQSVSEGVWSRLDRLEACAERLMTVGIECCDAVELIERIATSRTLIYADPPYLNETRTSMNDYSVDAGDRESHVRMLKVLLETPAKVILSGYPSELYDSVLEGWHRVEFAVTARSSNAARSSMGSRVECLWLNYEPDLGRLPL